MKRKICKMNELHSICGLLESLGTLRPIFKVQSLLNLTLDDGPLFPRRLYESKERIQESVKHKSAQGGLSSELWAMAAVHELRGAQRSYRSSCSHREVRSLLTCRSALSYL